MKVSYKRLWKLLIDKDMKKKDLMEQAGISSFSIRKLLDKLYEDVALEKITEKRYQAMVHRYDMDCE